MATDSAAPRRKPKSTSHSERTTELPDVIDATDPLDLMTTFRYSVTRPIRRSGAKPENLYIPDETFK
jgi:hypothetical protein